VFTDVEVRFAVTLAEVGGTAIRNARNYQKINLLLGRIEGHEKFLADIINSLQHQLLVLNRQRRVVLANRVFLEAVGKEEAEVVGTPYGALCRSDGDGRSCPVDQVLFGEEMRPFVQEFQAGEESRWYERSASPIRSADGGIEHVIEVIRDITAEHLLAEEKLQSSRLQGIVELAGTVAHEINSPLFAALGTAELLAEDEDRPEVAEDLVVIVRNLRQIGELTRKMTAMTGFTSTAYVGESRILNLNEDKNRN
jgi:PAS domain S-box-containing protein